MSNPSENNILRYLLTLCEEHGVFSAEKGVPHEDEDLIDGGRIDSMGLVYMQAVIEKELSVELPIEMLVSELRTIRLIAGYLAKRLSSQGLTALGLSLAAQSHNAVPSESEAGPSSAAS